MRLLVVSLLLSSSTVVLAQDGIIATPQAQMTSQQQELQTRQWVDQQNLNAWPLAVRKPRIMQQAGLTAGTIVVRMQDANRNSIIYYTTDGWTPTLNSIRYLGPVTVSAGTTLRAIAVVPGLARSLVQVAFVVAPGTPAPGRPSAGAPIMADGSPAASTKDGIELVFTAPVVSQGLQVGDPLPVALAADLVFNGAVVAPRGTAVLATVSQVEKRAYQGLPASISFLVRSVKLSNGDALPLFGTETVEGQSKVSKAHAVSVIPLGGLFVHGGEATIPQGAMLTAHISEGGGAGTAMLR